MKKKIRLTESQLENIIKQTINEELKEGWWDGVKGAAKSVYRQVRDGFKEAPQDLENTITGPNSMGKEVKDGIKGMPKTAKNFFGRVAQDSRSASVAGDCRKAAELVASIRECQSVAFKPYQRGQLTSVVKYLLKLAEDLDEQQKAFSDQRHQVSKTNTKADMGKYASETTLATPKKAAKPEK